MATKPGTKTALGCGALGAAIGLYACSSVAPTERQGDWVDEGGTDTSYSLLDSQPAKLDGAAEATVQVDAGPVAPCLGDTLAPVDGGVDANTPGDGGIDCTTSDACAPLCERVIQNFRVGVAEVAARCIRALPSCAGAIDVIPCVDFALARACPRPTSTAFCAPLVAGCVDSTGDAPGSFSKFGCETFASGLSTDGRATFSACVTSAIDGGACDIDVVACADNIRQ